jgi:hypothetical protein
MPQVMPPPDRDECYKTLDEYHQSIAHRLKIVRNAISRVDVYLTCQVYTMLFVISIASLLACMFSFFVMVEIQQIHKIQERIEAAQKEKQ